MQDFCSYSLNVMSLMVLQLLQANTQAIRSCDYQCNARPITVLLQVSAYAPLRRLAVSRLGSFSYVENVPATRLTCFEMSCISISPDG